MDRIHNILAQRAKNFKSGRVNPLWEEAKEFCEYLGLGTDRPTIVFILLQCRKFGAGRVFALRSYLKDANYDKKRVKGLIVSLLKEPTIDNSI